MIWEGRTARTLIPERTMMAYEIMKEPMTMTTSGVTSSPDLHMIPIISLTMESMPEPLPQFTSIRRNSLRTR